MQFAHCVPIQHQDNKLAVTRAASGNLTYAHLSVGGFYLSDANLILRDQICAKRFLISESAAVHAKRVASRRGLISHIKDLITRAKILAGIAMAAQTPLHLERCVLIHIRHLVDRTVTGITSDSLGDVDAVIEVHEVGERVDARPLQRLAGAVARANRLEQLRICPDLRVAIHASLGRRNTCKARHFDRRVTVTAIDTEPRNVVLMAKRDRLRLPHTLKSDVRGPLHDVSDTSQCGNDEYCAKDSGAGQRVRAAMKDLRHSLMRSGSKRPSGAFVSIRAFSVSVFVPSEKTTHRGFHCVCETGNYKYFFKLCRVILKIHTRNF